MIALVLMLCVQGMALSNKGQEVLIKISNASQYSWALINLGINGMSQPENKGMIRVGPREKKAVKMRFSGLPTRWPEKRVETHVGHFKLVSPKKGQKAWQDEMDLYIISEAGKIDRWECQTNESGLHCATIEKNGVWELDLVIRAR